MDENELCKSIMDVLENADISKDEMLKVLGTIITMTADGFFHC